jgi:hypothetical protein
MSRWKKFVLLNVCWVGGIVLAMVLNPHFMRYPLWVCILSISLPYPFLFYLWFGVKPAKDKDKDKDEEKTNRGMSSNFMIGFALFLLALDWLISHIVR